MFFFSFQIRLASQMCTEKCLLCVFNLKDPPTLMIFFCKECVSNYQIRAFSNSECSNNNYDDSISEQLMLIVLINYLL